MIRRYRRRVVRPATLVGGGHMKQVIASLGWAAALLVSGGAAAQGAAQPDFSKVEIKTHPVAGNFYYLEGQGGNVGVLIGDDGVLMIDDQFAPLTEKLTAAIKKLSTKPIRLLVNTHVHGDHTGGNENVGKMGVAIVAHDNVRVRLAKGVNGAAPAPAVARPMITYGDKLALHLDGEDIEVGKFPPAHTDGDSYIRFPKADVIHVGDVFRTVGYPVVDANNGGSVKGTIAALDEIIAMVGPSTKILPGHGVVSTKADVAAFRDMVVELQKKIGAMVKQGMTLEQVAAAKPTADFDAKYGSPDRMLPGFYQALKAEL
jgi:glyoxylase-like metal-dependent hydrolase (beta-lactamase superfamily II)